MGGVCSVLCTHSIRQANVAVAVVGAAAVDLVGVAGLLHHYRAGLHRFWSAWAAKHIQTHGRERAKLYSRNYRQATLL